MFELGLLGTSEKSATFPSVFKNNGRKENVYNGDFRKKQVSNIFSNIFFLHCCLYCLNPRRELAVGGRHSLALLLQRVRCWLAELLSPGFPLTLLGISLMLRGHQYQSKENSLSLWKKAFLRGSSLHRPSCFCFDSMSSHTVMFSSLSQLQDSYVRSVELK